MRALMFVAVAMVASAPAYAVDDMTQWKTLKGENVAGLIGKGYELKSVINKGQTNDYDYFLQKEGHLVMCRDVSSYIGRELIDRFIECFEYVTPYKR